MGEDKPFPFVVAHHAVLTGVQGGDDAGQFDEREPSILVRIKGGQDRFHPEAFATENLQFRQGGDDRWQRLQSRIKFRQTDFPIFIIIKVFHHAGDPLGIDGRNGSQLSHRQQSIFVGIQFSKTLAPDVSHFLSHRSSGRFFLFLGKFAVLVRVPWVFPIWALERTGFTNRLLKGLTLLNRELAIVIEIIRLQELGQLARAKSLTRRLRLLSVNARRHRGRQQGRHVKGSVKFHVNVRWLGVGVVRVCAPERCNGRV